MDLFTDIASWYVDHSGERRDELRIVDDLEVGQKVFDLATEQIS